MVEYALILAAIAVAAFATYHAMCNGIVNAISSITIDLTSA